MGSIDEFIEDKYKRKNKSIPKKSKVDAQYNVYKYQIIIFITCCRLLIHLQLELNNFFMASYSNCISTIYGFPLTDESNMDSINYITCILDNLKKSGKYWSSISELNKDKLFKRVLGYTNLIISNINIKNDLENKNNKMEILKGDYELFEQTYNWFEFRPPLNPILTDNNKSILIDLGDSDMDNMKSLSKSKKIFDEKNMYISLKIIEKINSIIGSSEIENIKYDPLPLKNMCCLSDINDNYTYFNYFNSKDVNNELNILEKTAKKLEKMNNKINRNSLELTYIKPLESEQKLKSFTNIFPKKKEIINNPKIINKLYETFIDEDINLGEKRLYKNNICLITGQNKIKISNNNYSYNDYQQILLNIHKKNIILSKKQPEEETTVEKNKNNEILSLRKTEALIDLNNIILLNINKLKKQLNNELLLQNNFIKKLVNKELDNILNIKNNDDIKLWDRLEQEINNEKKELYSILNRNVDKNRLKKINNIIDNLVRLKNIEDEDENNLLDIIKSKTEIKMLSKMRKFKRFELFYSKYITNYLKKYISVLSNKNYNYIIEIDDDSKNIKKSQKILNELNEDEFGFLNKYKNKNCRKIFKSLNEDLRKINISNIRGYKDIYDCNNNIIHRSRFNYSVSCKLLELIFIFLLNKLIDISEDINIDKIKTNKNKKKIVMSESEDDDELFEIGTTNQKIICNFVVDLLLKIDNDKKFHNKYSNSLVEKNIKTRNEETKDRNLYVMELLDLETRRLRNEQTKAGLTKYADLSKDFGNVLEQEKHNNNLLDEFKKINGNDFTEDMFEQYKESKEREVRIENEIRLDNEIYLDAEGDDELEI